MQQIDENPEKITIPGYDHPFLCYSYVCDNPDCHCHQVVLFFEETGTKNDSNNFDLPLDINTWQDNEQSARPPKIAHFIDQYISQLTPNKKEKYAQSYKDGKDIEKKIAQYHILPRDIKRGACIPYIDVINKDNFFSKGGGQVSYELDYNNKKYIAEDLYCADPHCDCNKAVLQFVDIGSSETTDNPYSNDAFQAEFMFNGELKLTETSNLSKQQANAVLAQWQEQHPNELEKFKQRYSTIKEIGKRCLATIPERIKTKKIGRNDPCPCGSGKKYKKCCLKDQ